MRLRRTLTAAWFVAVACGTVAAWSWRVRVGPLGEQALAPQAWAAAYERAHGHLEGLPQPRLSRLELALDIFPDHLQSQGRLVVRNDTPVAIPELHLTAPRNATFLSYRLRGDLAAPTESFPLRSYRLYRPLEPGETLLLRFAFDIQQKGLRREGALLLDASAFLPHIGYNPGLELGEARARRRHGLPAKLSNPFSGDAQPLHRFEATISTAAHHVAVAPGTLSRRWHEDGRALFVYHARTAAVPTNFSVQSTPDR